MSVWSKAARLFYFPALIYGVAILVKLAVGTPQGDLKIDLTGIHAVMGAVFLLYGASICYFMNMLQLVKSGILSHRLSPIFWNLSALIFFLVFCDATFGIHERMGLLGLPETSFFLFEGALLAGTVAMNVKNLHRRFLALFALFVACSGIAIMGDLSASGEGTIWIGEREVSYEQTFETLSALVLSFAYTCEALASFRGNPEM